MDRSIDAAASVASAGSVAAETARRLSPRLWFALIAPAAAWFVQEIACAVVTEMSCARGRPSAGRALDAAVSVAGLVVTLSAVAVARSNWRRLRGPEPLGRIGADRRDEMMALAGLLLGIVFSLAVLWAGLPLAIMHDFCGAAH